MKRKLLALLLALALLPALALPVAAADYSDNDITTLNAVLDNGGQGADVTWMNTHTVSGGGTITVPSGKSLTISGTITVNGNLTIEGGGAVVINTDGSLTVSGNLTLTGIPFMASTSGILDVDGDITIDGGSFEIANLTIGSGQTLTVKGDSKLTVTGTTGLTLNGGTLDLRGAASVSTIAMLTLNGGSLVVGALPNSSGGKDKLKDYIESVFGGTITELGGTAPGTLKLVGFGTINWDNDWEWSYAPLSNPPSPPEPELEPEPPKPILPVARPSESSRDAPVVRFIIRYYDNLPGDKVAYHAQGGFSSGDMAVITRLRPFREGYRFLGWSANPEGIGQIYLPGDSYTLYGNANLYAQWIDLE